MRTTAIKLLAACVAGLFAWSCTKTPVSQEAEPGQMQQALGESAAFTPGIVNIKLSEELTSLVEADLAGAGTVTKASSSAIAGLYSELGIVKMRRLFPDAGEYEERTRRAGLHRWYVVEFDPSVSLTKASTDFGAVPGIELVEQIYKVEPTSVFDDTRLGDQWHYYNDGSISGTIAGCDVNVVPVWELYTTGSPDVIVSVIDGGVDVSHPDIIDNLWTNPDTGSYGYNFVKGNSTVNGEDHGTHVAGIIAAVSNNGIGVAGLAGGNYAEGLPGVKIMSCQVFDGDESAKDFGVAIKWGADHGALISQNSWSNVVDIDGDGVISAAELNRAKNMDISESLREAIDYFIKYAGCDNDGNQLPDSPMKGGVVIFSAGNNNIQYGAPASCYDPIICIGAVGSDFQKASYSNFGDWVDLCAPGGSASNQILSLGLNGTYANMIGTSMACPHVSGVAALIISYFGGPGFTNEMLEERLIGGANTGVVASGARIGNLVDAWGSFNYGNGETAPDGIAELECEAQGNSITVSWTVPSKADGSSPSDGVMLFCSQRKADFDNFDPSSPAINIRKVDSRTYNCEPGEQLSHTLSGLSFGTAYYITAVPYNYPGKWGAYPEPVQVTTMVNSAPVVTTNLAEGEQIALKPSETKTVVFSISDPEGHKVTTEYVKGSGAESITTSSGNVTLLITSANAEEGDYVFTLVATDEYGLSTSYSLPYRLLENHAPEVAESIPYQLLYDGDRETLDISGSFSDEDGDMLLYSLASTNTSCVHLSNEGNVIYMTARQPGSTDVTVTARDVRGATASQRFRIVVRSEGELAEVYPTQVTTTMYVATGEQKETFGIRVYSASTGSIVLDESGEASAFEPAVFDLSAFAPGKYEVELNIDGQTVRKSIVKL